jgi:4-hydroxybenzoate polyprenyltransferase
MNASTAARTGRVEARRAARGLVFAAAGGFAVRAAIDYEPDRAKGLDDTIRSFAHTPAGPWLLVYVAAGLVLFGLFSFAMARWRRV